MGAKASKTAQSASRKFPSRAPGAVPPSSKPAAPRAPLPSSQTLTKTSATKDASIRADGHDPDPMMDTSFSQRLRQMGVATPNPTLSNSSTASPRSPPSEASPLGPSYPAVTHNQTLNALEARQRLQEKVELQLENPTAGREYVDVNTLRQALLMRQRGAATADIEKRLRLNPGVVSKIESGGVVTPLSL